MSNRPLPPFLADSLDSFLDHINANPEVWFKYFQDISSYAENADIEVLAAKNTLAAESANLTTARVNSDFLKGELEEAQDQIFEARHNEQKALDIPPPTNSVIPPVSASAVSSESTPTPPGSTMGGGISTPTTTESTHSTYLSERLPDPSRFQGDRRDFHRFNFQIRDKMRMNHDRFPTPQSRMSYVNSCLGRKPYAYIIPYIKDGECQLSDYEDILKILEDIYWSYQDRMHARRELFRLRQTNDDFATFFAEFDRLAVEGEMPESLLPLILERAISKELRALLLHCKTPSSDYREFATVLQNLENRRRLYFSSLETPVTVDHISTPGNVARRGMYTSATDLDAINLSNRRRTTRREKGECFRCGSKNHLVAQCPHPDTRQFRRTALSRSRNAL